MDKQFTDKMGQVINDGVYNVIARDAPWLIDITSKVFKAAEQIPPKANVRIRVTVTTEIDDPDDLSKEGAAMIESYYTVSAPE